MVLILTVKLHCRYINNLEMKISKHSQLINKIVVNIYKTIMMLILI